MLVITEPMPVRAAGGARAGRSATRSASPGRSGAGRASASMTTAGRDGGARAAHGERARRRRRPRRRATTGTSWSRRGRSPCSPPFPRDRAEAVRARLRRGQPALLARPRRRRAARARRHRDGAAPRRALGVPWERRQAVFEPIGGGHATPGASPRIGHRHGAHVQAPGLARRCCRSCTSPTPRFRRGATRTRSASSATARRGSSSTATASSASSLAQLEGSAGPCDATAAAAARAGDRARRRGACRASTRRSTP